MTYKLKWHPLEYALSLCVQTHSLPHDVDKFISLNSKNILSDVNQCLQDTVSSRVYCDLVMSRRTKIMNISVERVSANEFSATGPRLITHCHCSTTYAPHVCITRSTVSIPIHEHNFSTLFQSRRAPSDLWKSIAAKCQRFYRTIPSRCEIFISCLLQCGFFGVVLCAVYRKQP